ncbi:unnamed protein product [Amoebophrya sp. A25]|nr:unnamed protein product [Amoebophrya sp. A25]|eukprot:GSA25T00025617001.1
MTKNANMMKLHLFHDSRMRTQILQNIFIMVQLQIVLLFFFTAIFRTSTSTTSLLIPDVGVEALEHPNFLACEQHEDWAEFLQHLQHSDLTDVHEDLVLQHKMMTIVKRSARRMRDLIAYEHAVAMPIVAAAYAAKLAGGEPVSAALVAFLAIIAMEVSQIFYWLRRIARAIECQCEAEEAVLALNYGKPHPTSEIKAASQALAKGLYIAPRFNRLSECLD